MKDRVIKILDILATYKSIKLDLLAELLKVSQVTLRKDLDKLERRGMLCRNRGCITLDGAGDTAKRMALHHSIKRKIAKAVVETIEEGETVMLEGGSCCALLAEELALAKKNVTIITNSAFIIHFVRRLPNIKIILLGGLFQPESQVMVGPATKKCAEVFNTGKFFLGTDGFIQNYGFTCGDHMRAETSIGLAELAKKVFVLTESTKFSRYGAYNSIQFNKLAGVFTDDNIPEEAEATLIKNNVEFHKVPSN